MESLLNSDTDESESEQEIGQNLELLQYNASLEDLPNTVTDQDVLWRVKLLKELKNVVTDKQLLHEISEQLKSKPGKLRVLNYK